MLLAEDDREFRGLVARALHRSGFRVWEATDGTDALGYLARLLCEHVSLLQPDLVIADVRMPRFSGFDVLEAAIALDPHLPVVLITAFGSRELHERARQRGAALILDKPFELETLVDRVRTLLVSR